MLFWGGTDWTLQHAKPAAGASEAPQGSPVVPPDAGHLKFAHLGAKLTADALKQHLPATQRCG